MPRHSLAGSKTQTAYHRGSVVEQEFIWHCAADVGSEPSSRFPEIDCPRCSKLIGEHAETLRRERLL
jgi:hypothetical protein